MEFSIYLKKAVLNYLSINSPKIFSVPFFALFPTF